MVVSDSNGNKVEVKNILVGEVWMASKYEGKEATAEEISQLLYHAQVMMLANELELEDIYRYL